MDGAAVSGHDWHHFADDWLAAIADRRARRWRNVHGDKTARNIPPNSASQTLPTLCATPSQFPDPNALQSDPLLKGTLIVERCGPDSNQMIRVGMLKKVLQEAAAPLQAFPRQASFFFRVLHHTYFQPGRQQAAELLDLPFSTYATLHSGMNL